MKNMLYTLYVTMLFFAAAGCGAEAGWDWKGLDGTTWTHNYREDKESPTQYRICTFRVSSYSFEEDGRSSSSGSYTKTGNTINFVKGGSGAVTNAVIQYSILGSCFKYDGDVYYYSGKK